MICRFIMPFRDSVCIELQNLGEKEINIEGEVQSAGYTWEEEESMYFHARWKCDHDLVASHESPFDIPYLLSNGRGVLVGASTLLMNPTSVPGSNGNWWGEGDEKIYVDDDVFPSFFGTGSEDYYNYAWSSPRIFSHAYCGQTRNDGPGNRGHVVNFRWHILDPVPFNERIAFYIELRSHGTVPGFSYARTVYYYGMTGIYDDYVPLTAAGVRLPELPESWSPEQYRFSENAVFFEAGEVVDPAARVTVEHNRIWTESKLLVWKPQSPDDELKFDIPVESKGRYLVLFTACRSPESGSFRARINGVELKSGGNPVVDLYEPYGTLSRSIRFAPVELDSGMNTIALVNEGTEGQQIGIDFIWIKKQ
jgi:hypothetical protein